MPNILLFENSQERLPQLIFLLKLAGIDCTVAKTVDELLNWHDASQMMLIDFDLFLLNSLTGSGLDNVLLTELCNIVTVPIVCVKRENVSPSIFYNHRVTACHPDELLDCISGLLACTDESLV